MYNMPGMGSPMMNGQPSYGFPGPSTRNLYGRGMMMQGPGGMRFGTMHQSGMMQGGAGGGGGGGRNGGGMMPQRGGAGGGNGMQMGGMGGMHAGHQGPGMGQQHMGMGINAAHPQQVGMAGEETRSASSGMGIRRVMDEGCMDLCWDCSGTG